MYLYNVFSENFEYLKQFLCEMAPPNRSCTILNWNIGGKILLKYISICQSMEQFKEVGKLFGFLICSYD